MIPAIRCLCLLLLCAAQSAGQDPPQDTYPTRRLTSDPAQEGFPAWSPDGTTIVFSRIDKADRMGLWKIRPEGGPPWQFTHEIGEHSKWSPDDHYVVFDGDSGNSIKVVSSVGGTPVRIVPDSIRIVRGGNPLWSPDGTCVAFKENSNLRVLDLTRGTASVLLHRDGFLLIPGCWSRDGGRIFLCAKPDTSRQSAIWAATLSGEVEEIIPLSAGKVLRYCDQSQDGSMIAYVACEGRNCDIWVMPSGGGASIQLTTHPAYDDTPQWSPDGTKILFTSTRSGNFDIWCMDLDINDLRTQLGLSSLRD